MSAYLLILCCWVGLGVIFVGLGALVRRGFGDWPRGGDDWVLCFWLGWIASLFVLQLWHLFLPVDGQALWPLAALALVGIAGSKARPWVLLGRRVLTYGPALLAVAVITAWTAGRVLVGSMHGDAGLYFFPTIGWITHHSIVPGLGNLYGPLGYNQTYFLYAALLETGPLAGHGHYAANGLLLVFMLARASLGGYRLLLQRPGPQDLYYLLLFPALVGQALHPNVRSSHPDFAIFALGLVLTGELVKMIWHARGPGPRREINICLLSIMLLSIGGVTIKLSFAALGGLTVILAGGIWLMGRRRGAKSETGAGSPRRTLVAVALLLALSLGPWVARGIITTGYPAFPLPMGAAPVEWRVPKDHIAQMHKDISIWRLTQTTWWRALQDLPWLRRTLASQGWAEKEVWLPPIIALVGVLLGLGRWILGRWVWRGSRAGPGHGSSVGSGGVSAIILLPAGASIFFVFATAVRPRFAGAAFWLLAAGGILLALGPGVYGRGWWRRILRLTVVVGALYLSAQPFLSGPALIWEKPPPAFSPTPGARVVKKNLSTGLTVYFPQGSMSCWGRHRPCTPEPNERLMRRHKSDLGFGFMIDPGVALDRPWGI